MRDKGAALLRSFFVSEKKAALGLSGGVDSAYLLYAGLSAGAEVRPYFISTPFQPAFELEDARRLCRELQAELTVIELDILSMPGVSENPANRCYFCKSALFGALKSHAAEDGFSLIIDGTNASDDISDRPGMRALFELSVRSPLRECGLNKSDIRELARAAGLFCHSKPAYACLATRVPAGTRLTAELLTRIEGAEDALFRLGYENFRVRVCGERALIQIDKSQLSRAMSDAASIKAATARYFAEAEIAAEGR